jgi:hypothetical protein
MPIKADVGLRAPMARWLSGTQIRHGGQLVIPDVGAAEALDEGSVPVYRPGLVEIADSAVV